MLILANFSVESSLSRISQISAGPSLSLIIFIKTNVSLLLNSMFIHIPKYFHDKEKHFTSLDFLLNFPTKL